MSELELRADNPQSWPERDKDDHVQRLEACTRVLATRVNREGEGAGRDEGRNDELRLEEQRDIPEFLRHGITGLPY